MSDDNKITLHAFTELVAKRAGVSSADANTYIHQLAKTMAEALEKGDYIHLYHFGRFQTTLVAEQAGHNPNSGKPLTIAEHSRVQFHPYTALRFAVNAPFNQLRIKELSPDKTSWRTRTGAWILALLLLVLLILLGINWKRGMPAQDVVVVPPEKAADKVVVAPPEQAPVPSTPPAAAVPAVVATAPTKKPAATNVFIVSPGDTLWSIAASTWNNPYLWPLIYEENRPELSRQNPDLIDNGIALRIPVQPGTANTPKAADRRQETHAYRVVADDYRKLGNPRAANYSKVAASKAKE